MGHGLLNFLWFFLKKENIEVVDTKAQYIVL